MLLRLHQIVIVVTGLAAFAITAPPAFAAGRFDSDSVIVIAHGTFGGVKYVRYEAMFQGLTSDRHPYRVPCQIIAPAMLEDGRGLVLFDWLNTTTVEVGGKEVPFARYMMTDDFLFDAGAAYATVRCDAVAIGVPWSDGRLDTSTEFIQSAGDEYEIVADYINALKADPVAELILGEVTRTAAFGYSKSGGRLRGILRLD